MTLSIRTANVSDIEAVVGFGVEFFKYAKYDDMDMPLDKESLRDSLKTYFSDPNFIMLLLCDNAVPVGGVSGWVMPWGFNRNIKIGLEYFYFVYPQYRGRNSIKLLKAYESMLLVMGAKKSIMIMVNTDLADGVEKLYNRMGYGIMEKYYIKSLEKK